MKKKVESALSEGEMGDYFQNEFYPVEIVPL
jgi:hypothetical protein